MVRSLPERVEGAIGELQGARNLDMVFAALSKWVGRMGFTNFSYWLLMPPEGPRKPFFITNYPAKWIERRLEMDFGAHDYVGRFAVRSVLPFLWDSLLERFTLTDVQKAVFHEASSIGLSAGGTIPIHGPAAAKATFSVVNDMPRAEFARLFTDCQHELLLIAMYAHERILGFNLHAPLVNTIALTPRETEALTWVARGKTRWEVGVILGISEETIKVHLENARKKLGASNNTHAIAVAMLNGLLLP